MSLPSLNFLIQSSVEEIVVCAKPWAKDLLSGLIEQSALATRLRFISLRGKWSNDCRLIKQDLHNYPVESTKKAVGLLLPDSLTSTLTFRLAGLSCCGYRDDGRSLLLKWPVTKPSPKPHAVLRWYGLTQKALQAWDISSNEQEQVSSLLLPLTQDHQRLAAKIMQQHDLISKQFILIAPTATGLHLGKNKVWPHFAELTQALQALGYRVVMSPPSNEKTQAVVNAPCAECLPPLSLGSFVALLEQASLVICNDSGVAHLCATTNTQQITLIGVTDPKHTGPWSANAHILGQMGQWPDTAEVIALVKQLAVKPPPISSIDVLDNISC